VIGAFGDMSDAEAEYAGESDAARRGRDRLNIRLRIFEPIQRLILVAGLPGNANTPVVRHQTIHQVDRNRVLMMVLSNEFATMPAGRQIGAEL